MVRSNTCFRTSDLLRHRGSFSECLSSFLESTLTVLQVNERTNNNTCRCRKMHCENVCTTRNCILALALMEVYSANDTNNSNAIAYTIYVYYNQLILFLLISRNIIIDKIVLE